VTRIARVLSLASSDSSGSARVQADPRACAAAGCHGTGDSLRRIRQSRPLVHQITNFVVMNETANATLALGALPVMAHAPGRWAPAAASVTSPAPRPAGSAARRLGCVVAVTGPVDAVSDGRTTLRVANGHPMLATVSGTGCIASAISGCFAAVNPTQPLRAAVEALVALGVAGEDAAEHSTGPGSFHVALYDALYALSPDAIDERARVSTA